MGIIKTQMEIQMSSFWELLCKWMDGQAGLNALMWISISFNLKCPLDFLWKAESYQSHYFIQASNSSFAFKKKNEKGKQENQCTDFRQGENSKQAHLWLVKQDF